MTDNVLSSAGERLTVPPSATAQEAAAIVAAVGEQLATESAEADDTAPTWDGRRFQFAGRIEAVTGTSRRVPTNAPTDEWTALGRSDRFKR